ncbi:MAG: prepilin-type N-terminal cleavage/methylation domain-containing protein [Lachnospiraceae bacterium]|nr:prepilin-type N-terminal cleavage/methylation domain-containing protein [Lachnospiraceae bacterium]
MNKKDNIKLNDQGLSLIEIIIVLAIMTIIGAATILSTRVATDKHVNSCAEKIASSLEQTRGLALGKREAYLTIAQDADGVHLQMYVDGKPYGELFDVGRPGVQVNLLYSDGSSSSLASSVVRIDFSRSNGSATTNPASVVEIAVTNTSREIHIKIDKFTGRVSTHWASDCSL